MTVAVADTLVWASDPEPFGSQLVYDFIAGQIFAAFGSEEAGGTPTNADATAAAAAGTAYDAVIQTSGTPDPQPVRLTKQQPFPRVAGGRTVVLRLEAHLGNITAHAVTRSVFADDEELLELL